MKLDGGRVQKYLDENNKSREWLAVQLDCSINTVRKILAGGLPHYETVHALADLLGCRIDELVIKAA